MKKHKLIIAIIIVIIIAVLLYTYSANDKLPSAAKKLEVKNEKITIEKNDIELHSYLYDSYAKAGVCLFIVPPSTTAKGLNSVDGFGSEDRFELYQILLMDRKVDIVSNRKKLKIYYQFLADTDGYDDKIYLYDRNSGKTHDVSSGKSASGSYTLTDNVKSKSYKIINENLELHLSQICVGVTDKMGKTAVMPGNLKICYKDGTVYELIKDSNLNGKFIALKNNNEKHSFERCVFKDVIDIDNIKNVIVNGKAYF